MTVFRMVFGRLCYDLEYGRRGHDGSYRSCDVLRALHLGSSEPASKATPRLSVVRDQRTVTNSAVASGLWRGSPSFLSPPRWSAMASRIRVSASCRDRTVATQPG